MVLTRSGINSDGMDQQPLSTDREVAGEHGALLSASGVAHVPPGVPPPPAAGPSGASTSAAQFLQSPQSPPPHVYPGTPVVMTDQHFAYLLSLVRAPVPPPAPSVGAMSGNFANCSSRFDGAKESDVLAFVDAIEIYKECVGIEDHIALRGLPMLLSGLAATWWQGVKASVHSWPEAVELLKQTYGPRLPPHRLYRKIFEREQGDEPTDIFVCKVRALLAQLPPTAISQEAQLDMVYGLLHKRIREKICRKSFSSFSELLAQARSVEDILDEGRSSQQSQIKKTREPVAPMAADSASPVATTSSSRTVRARCNYCKQFGHLKDECPKLSSKKAVPYKIKKEVESTSASVTCFGCGTPGVIRANCPTCNDKQGPSTSSSAFQSVAAIGSKAIDARQRPVVDLEIYGANGSALFDTGAKQSVASESLREHLVANGHEFDKVFTNVKLADGSCKNIVVDVAKVDVKVAHGPLVSTLFIVLPGATETLLGMNFISDAGVVLDFKNCRYTFDNVPRYFPMKFESEVARLACSAIELRADEGSTLSPSQRSELSNVLSHNGDIFNPGGASTTFAVHRIDTGSHPPISVPPYRVSPLKKELMRKEIDKMLADGVIEEAESDWTSPVVMVPKKNGEVRFCVDYRKLNSITKTDKYPLPLIDDILMSTKVNAVMSTIDLKSGYWQVDVAPEDRDKTAFVTPFGTFRFRRMPFGLKNSPSTFQRMMDRFRTGLKDITRRYPRNI